MDELEKPEPEELTEWSRWASEQIPVQDEKPPIDAAHLTAVALAGFMVIIAALIVLWPERTFEQQQTELSDFLVSTTYSGRVLKTGVGSCEGCIDVSFVVTDGPDEGRIVTQTFSDSQLTGLEEGDGVVLSYREDVDEQLQYQYNDRQRRGILLAVAFVFAGAVVVLGRLKGLSSLVGLAGSLAILYWFVLPGILDGKPPVLIAIVGAGAIAYLVLYLAHGFRPLTTVALVGSLAALSLSAVLSSVVVQLSQLTGFSSEEATFLTLFSEGLDFRGLVLAGIVLGAMGALDDVTVTQASAVWELRAANQNMPRRKLFQAALRIGRDHIASTVNTLALAYAGAALPLLALFVLSGQSLGTLANSEEVATEIVRTLVGSIALVAAVPLTTWLAVYSHEA